MKKQIWSALLALAMLLTTLPTSALAAEEEDITAPVGEETVLSADSGNDTQPEEPGWDDIPTNDLVTIDEVPEFVPGVVPEEYEFTYPNYEASAISEVPASYGFTGDYTNLKVTGQSSVKSQGSNGLCWAFGFYAAVEANYKKTNEEEIDLSELHMGYATSNTSDNRQQGFDRNPSDGGNRLYSSAYLMRSTNLSGAVLETDDKYITTILPLRDLSITQSKEKSYQVQNIMFLTGGKKATAPEVTVIKESVRTYGGVGASMQSDQTTATNGTGSKAYYNSDEAAYYYYDGNGTSTNHLVEIVGWDDNYPVENFTKTPTDENGEPMNGAWLVKNSWGTNWGNNGYFWISYADTNFPIGTFCIDGVKEYTPSDAVYETDYKTTSSWDFGDYDYFARIYTTETANESLSSVRVFVGTPAKIDVDCSSQFNTTDYTFDSKGTINAAYPGWYTITLNSPVSLSEAGTQFAVVVKLTKFPSTPPQIGYDHFADINDGTSYMGKANESGIVSFTSCTTNFSIKAVTTLADPDQTVADKAADKLTWDTIRNENENEKNVCTDLILPAKGSYGTTISWSSTSAVIDTNGKVDATTSETEVTLTATVKFGARNATKTFALTVPAVSSDVLSAANLITWESIKGDNTDQNAVASDLDLTSSIGSVTVTWTSSNNKIINPETGKVICPRFDKTENDVTLIATVTDGSTKKQVTIPVKVTNRAADAKDKYDVAKEWLNADTRNRWWPLIKGENAKPGQIRYDLKIPNEVTVNLDGFEPYTINVLTNGVTQSKADTNQPWGCVSDQGAVTRPAYGQSNSEGAFFIFLFNGTNYSGYCPVWLTVLAYRGELHPEVADVTVFVGSTATLTVTPNAEGAPGTLSYQWYTTTGDDADASKGTKIENATSAEFAIPEELTAGTYYFYCVVSGEEAEPVPSNVATVNIVKADYTGTTEADVPCKYGMSKTYDLKALLPTGYEHGTIEEADSDIFIGTPTIDGTSLTYELADNPENVGKTATITISVTSAYYKDFNLIITVTVTEKIVPDLEIEDLIVTYSGEAIPDSAIQGTATAEGETVTGTWKFVEGQDLVNVADSGVKKVIFTPDNTDVYDEVPGIVTVTINKADPNVTVPTDLKIISGEALSTVELLEGWTWDDPETIVDETAAFLATYTPSDTANYNVLKRELTVTAHEHKWAAAWRSNATHHWHNCTASGCTVTSNRGKAGYAAHAFDNNADTTCNICGYTRMVTPPTTGFTITFRTASGSIPGGTTSGNGAYIQMTTDADGKIISLPTATRSGYTFSGWFTEETGGTRITTSTVFIMETSVYAQWTRNSSSGGITSSTTYAISAPSQINGGMVKVSPTNAKRGNTVTITVTPNSEYELDKLTVTDSKGKELPLTNEGGGEYTFIMPASKVTVDVSFVASPFTDVQAGAYYYDAVTWAVEQGITTGTTDTTFSPDSPCTRAQIVTFLWRAAGSPKANAGSPFTDVPEGSYYYDAVLWAVEQRITSGTSATTFSPDSPCTRAQVVTFLYRYEKSPAISGGNTFTDVVADTYYSNAVQWAVDKTVTTGTSATTFSPNATCTRGQIVTFLYRDMA